MPTGDTLTLITLAIGTMIAALNMSGWRAILAWAVTAATLMLAAVYAGALPSFGVALVAATPIVNALVFPMTIGFVALMLREKRDRPAPEAAPDADTPLVAHLERRPSLGNAAIEVSRARSAARAAVANRQPNLDPTVAKMESALATMRHTFGVETPAATGDKRRDLTMWLEYFDVVWPFIQGNNYDDAKVRAAQFVVERQPGRIREG